MAQVALTRTFRALEWLTEEIEINLGRAHEALILYIEKPAETGHLKECLHYIHQVRGCLVIAEVTGVLPLVEETEALIGIMLESLSASPREYFEVLAQALNKLPVYLNQVVFRGEENPASLIPLVNDLRALRGLSLYGMSHGLEEAFSPAGEARSAEDLPRDDKDVASLVRKLRKTFQSSLVGLLKGSAHDNIKSLEKVCARLREICRGTPRENLWWVAGAFLEGLFHHSIPLGPAARRLLRDLDRELGLLQADPAANRDQSLPGELFSGLLYYLAMSGGETPRVRSVVDFFNLEEIPGSAVPSVDFGARVYDAEIIRRVSGGLLDELEQMKDLLARSGQEAVDRDLLEETRHICRRIVATLHLMAKPDLLLLARELETSLLEASALPLQTLAQTVVGLESALCAWQINSMRDHAAPDLPAELRVEVNRAWNALLGEVRGEVERIKNTLVEFFSASGSHDQLAEVPAAIRQVAGALDMVNLVEAARRLGLCSRFIEEQLFPRENHYNHQACEALADVITSVEHYLDDVAAGMSQDNLATLALADRAIQHMGYVDELLQCEKQPEPQEPEPQQPEQQEPSIEVKIMSPPKDADRADSSAAPDIDPEIRDIFVEEAREVLDTLGDAFPRWREDTANQEALRETRRAFHTLKGSGRMVGANAIGELAWSVENMLNRVLDNRIEAGAALLDVVEQVIQLVPGMVSAFEQGQQDFDRDQEASLRDAAARLANGEAAPSAAPATAAAAPVTIEDSGIDPALLEIFVLEARGHLEALADFVATQRENAPFYGTPSHRLQAALHTLKGSAHMASIQAIAGLITPLEKFVKELLSFQIKVDEDTVDLLADCHAFSASAIASLEAGTAPDTADLEQIRARTAELRERLLGPVTGQDTVVAAVDPSFLNLLMADGIQMVLEAENTLAGWMGAGRVDAAQLDTMIAELHELESGAEKAGIPAMAAFSARLASLYRGFTGEPGIFSPEDHAILQQAHDCLLNMADAVAANQDVGRVPEDLAAALGTVALQVSQPESQTALQQNARQGQPEPEPVPQSRPQPEAVAPVLPEDLDEEVVELFITEAEELLESLELGLQQWSEAPASQAPADSIKRDLHTFKGGARMAGLEALGNLSHDFESIVMEREADIASGNTAPFTELMAWYDRLSAALDGFRKAFASADSRREIVDTAPPPAAAIQQPVEAEAPGWTTAEILPFTGAYKGLYPQSQRAVADIQQSTAEQVRIAANVLDMLVNLAGESSISRSQVEQNINEFIFSLDEMEATIRRMQDQVRRLAIETDAQVVFRREQIEASESIEGFDPLEMDRYSQLQQLSRSLLESASDLQDLRDTLVDKSRDAESLLLQQSRINTDLQEGLMRTRMVSFSRIVPRLRRVVRQVGSAVGKHVNLQLGNVEGELDRSVLERVLSPLEHMIRNAIDHGIEAQDKRLELGKNPEGTISISFSREGGDVLIRLADDGRGLDIEAIRARAFAMGLLNEHTSYSDNDIAQCIFQPGFSTSAAVTQTSGRGVGMDVVNSEVRQLGGTVTMTTRQGAGTEFQVRLPFTVSVNRALMIELGEDSYALALNSISGVTRISREQLLDFYRNPGRTLEYGGQNYEVRYLGSLLSAELRPTLDTAQPMLPLVLIRADDRQYAVQVDALVGSREIVVKTLGSQFSRVPGLSGATVLGDGRVVVILDLQGLLRDQAAAATVLAPVAEVPRPSPRSESHVQTIMVVDDSVTVRKVTSRFLEREGFRVVTAKDGVDAMRALQDITPDMMLLDIEMPRMDGFEVARLVRSTQRLKDLPIIMITSRTGDKHRERALAMGVNRYLGKPYQEDVLIREVYGLLTTAETG